MSHWYHIINDIMRYIYNIVRHWYYSIDTAQKHVCVLFYTDILNIEIISFKQAIMLVFIDVIFNDDNYHLPSSTVRICLENWWRHQMEAFTHYWPFMWGIRRSPLNSLYKCQWPGAPEQMAVQTIDTPVIYYDVTVMDCGGILICCKANCKF